MNDATRLIDVPLFIDVNIPMYAAGKPHAYKNACIWVMTEIAADRLDAVIDVEIVQELLYRYSARQERQIAVAMATSLLALIPTVLPVTIDAVRLAVQLFDRHAPQGVKARDVIHAAVMQQSELQHIISTDRHFDYIPNLVRLDPLDLFALHGSRQDVQRD